MKEQEELAKAEGSGKDEEVPEQLRLAFREDLGKGAEGKSEEKATDSSNAAPAHNNGQPSSPAVAPSPQTPAPSRTVPAPPVQIQQRRAPVAQQEDIPAWIDKAIIGIIFAIFAILFLRFF